MTVVSYQPGESLPWIKQQIFEPPTIFVFDPLKAADFVIDAEQYTAPPERNRRSEFLLRLCLPNQAQLFSRRVNERTARPARRRHRESRRAQVHHAAALGALQRRGLAAFRFNEIVRPTRHGA